MSPVLDTWTLRRQKDVRVGVPCNSTEGDWCRGRGLTSGMDSGSAWGPGVVRAWCVVTLPKEKAKVRGRADESCSLSRATQRPTDL